MTERERAAIWLRVSTEEQTAANQLPALERMAAERGYEVVKTYTVEASAFKGRHNPALAQVVAAGRRREFTVLLVWSLDRLERGGVQATFETLSRLSNAGVRVISQAPGEDWTLYPAGFGDVMLALLSWVAHQESVRRSERTRAGMARARAEGKVIGRPGGAGDKRPRKRAGYFRRYAE